MTVAGGVPTVFRMMTPEFEKRPEAASSLRLIVATGEVFPVPVKERLRAAIPHVGLYTFLAQTEAGYIAALRPGEQEARPHATGRPIMGVETRVVGADGNDVPRGEPGELLVRCGAPGRAVVMREYFRDPGATEAAFDGDWFRTGDVGYFDADGYLYFVDRAKDMIVTGGLNVYSKEVEIALIDHAAVADAAVVGVPDEEFGEAVAACVILEDGGTASADELIEHCRAADRELQEAEARALLRRPAPHRHRQGDEAGVEETAGGDGMRDHVCRPHSARSRRPGADRVPVPRDGADQLDDEGQAARRPHRGAGDSRALYAVLWAGFAMQYAGGIMIALDVWTDTGAIDPDRLHRAGDGDLPPLLGGRGPAQAASPPGVPVLQLRDLRRRLLLLI